MRIIASCLLAITAAANPAAAAPVPFGPPPPAYWADAPIPPSQRLDNLHDRINTAQANGSLSPQQAGRARDELERIALWVQSRHYDNGHLGRAQKAEFEQRIDRIVRSAD